VVVILVFLTGFSGLAAPDRLALLVQHNTLAPGLVQAFGILAGQSVKRPPSARDWFKEPVPAAAGEHRCSAACRRRGRRDPVRR
jgi:hypothetical protein